MSVRHEMVRVERTFNAPVNRVFQAWRDSVALSRWYLPGDEGWFSEVLEHDFRVGGIKKLTFGPQEGAPYTEDCRYEDIVEEQRIVYTMTIGTAGERLTASLVTIEFVDVGGTTNILVTDQVAILDGGDTAADREQGWGEVLDRLAREFA